MKRDKIAEYLALEPHKNYCIRSLNVIWPTVVYWHERDGITYTGCVQNPERIELLFMHGLEPGRGLLLKFDGILQLKITGDYEHCVNTISTLEIKDISDWQWDVTYQVYGAEMDGGISFYCGDFSWELVEIESPEVRKH